MPFSRVILASQLMLTSVPAALAQDKCDSLDRFVQSVFMMQQAEETSVRAAAATHGTGVNFALPPALSGDLLISPLARVAHGVVQSVSGEPDRLDIKAPAFVSAHARQDTRLNGSPLPAGFGPRIAELQELYGCLPADVMHGRWQVDPASNAHITEAAGNLATEGSAAMGRSSDAADRPWREAGSSADQQFKAVHVLDLLDNHNALIALMSLTTLAGLGLIARSRKPADPRRSERHTCHREVPFRFGRQTQTLTIVDVGRYGVKCRHDSVFRARRSLQLKLGKGWLRGKIVWFNGTFAGIRTVRPLSDEEIAFLCTDPEDSEAPGS